MVTYLEVLVINCLGHIESSHCVNLNHCKKVDTMGMIPSCQLYYYLFLQTNSCYFQSLIEEICTKRIA